MKVNKWTLGLAAVGLVSLPTLSTAEEKLSPIDSAVQGIVLSGYVDTAIHWNVGSGNANNPNYAYNQAAKSDGFNLNAFKVSLEKPLDEATWAAGYKAELLFGPNATVLNTLGGGNSTAIKQAYVHLRAPVYNGLDFKIGVFDTIIGYESTDAVNNPNYTRSYGYSIEPTTHTGVLATYTFNEMVAASAGIANSFGPTVGGMGGINDKSWPTKAESYKTYMASVALTAPEKMGFLKGSTLYLGVINGFNGSIVADQTSFYVGSTLATPVKGLKLGASYDYVGVSGQTLTGGTSAWINDLALYVSYQIPDTKWSIHGRGEYLWQSDVTSPINLIPTKVLAITGTLQYDLWKNVLSRLELRWDHAADGAFAYGGTVPGTPTRKNSYLVAANFVYKF